MQGHEYIIMPLAFSVAICFLGNGLYFLMLGFFPYRFKHIKEMTDLNNVTEIKQPLKTPTI